MNDLSPLSIKPCSVLYAKREWSLKTHQGNKGGSGSSLRLGDDKSLKILDMTEEKMNSLFCWRCIAFL